MSSANWRSPGDYEGLRSLDAPGFAWEYLCRNPEFARDRTRLGRAARRGASTVDAARAFAERWKCELPVGAATGGGMIVSWMAEVLPSVIAITQCSRNLGHANHLLSPRELKVLPTAAIGEHVIEWKDAASRVHVVEPHTQQPAVILPLDRLFDIRAEAALRLWRGLTGRNLGPNPAALSRARRDRLLLGLRALDGWIEGASYREIAGVVFSLGDIAAIDWKSHDLRGRVIRLVRGSREIMQGGYLRLLLHPFRGIS